MKVTSNITANLLAIYWNPSDHPENMSTNKVFRSRQQCTVCTSVIWRQINRCTPKGMYMPLHHIVITLRFFEMLNTMILILDDWHTHQGISPHPPSHSVQNTWQPDKSSSSGQIKSHLLCFPGWLALQSIVLPAVE